MILFDADYDYHSSNENSETRELRISAISVDSNLLDDYRGEIFPWLDELQDVVLINLPRAATVPSIANTYGSRHWLMEHVFMFSNHDDAVMFRLRFGGRFMSKATIFISPKDNLDLNGNPV